MAKGTEKTDGNTVIMPGLRADIMRNLMETKDTLTQKGSLYVGSGNKTIIDGMEICQTVELPTGGAANAGKVLTVSDDGGLEYRKLNKFYRYIITLNNKYYWEVITANSGSVSSVSQLAETLQAKPGQSFVLDKSTLITYTVEGKWKIGEEEITSATGTYSEINGKEN